MRFGFRAGSRALALLLAATALVSGSAALGSELEHRLVLHGAESTEDEPFAGEGPFAMLEPLPAQPHGSTVPESQLYEQIIEQCRSFRRNLAKIGKDASPDGRPQTCRLISFMRRQRWRDATARRRRLRWQPPVVELPRLRAPAVPIVSVDSPSAPRVAQAPAPSPLRPIPLAVLIQMVPRPTPMSPPRPAPVKGER